MSKVLQAANRLRRMPSYTSNAAPQQPQPVFIDMPNEFIDEGVVEGGPGQHTLAHNQPLAQSVLVPSSKMSRFKRSCRRLYRKFGMKYMITLFMMIIYTIIGAAAFLQLEKEQDIKRLQDELSDYEEGRKGFAENLTAFLIANPGRAWKTTELQQFIDEYDQKRGLKPNTATVWNFWHAMYFAGTIYTTIGYGDIFCRTTSGRVVTMIYSLIGIPLMLITLTDLGGLLLKFMFALTRLGDACKARFSPAVLFGPHPPGYDSKPVKYRMSRGSQGESGLNEAKDRTKTEADDDDVDLYELERREDEHYEYQLMRVPVLIALATTIGWIFICAGLFCLWEDWDYFTSVYFFFISLSTIGLGDETPNRKDIMVATYFFVIIGLSLVSMCITVIQRRLEDLYLQLLQMILQEYQRKLMQGNDQTGATVGMMQAWQKSKKARFLMPLLSKDKKQTVAKRFHDEAKARGIVLPAVLRDLNPKSGLPSVLHVAKTQGTEAPSKLHEAVGEAIQRASAKARALNEPVDEAGLQAVYITQPETKEYPAKTVTVIPAAPPPAPISYDADAQTDQLEMEDKQEQTVATPLADAQTQSQDSSFATNLVEDASQTPITEMDDASTECKLDEDDKPPEPDESENETQTEILELAEASSQTSKITNKEQEIQTHIYDLNANETQTDRVETKNQRLQTPVPDYLEQGAQTDPLILDPEQFQATGTLSLNPNGQTGWSKAKRNLKKAINKAKTGMHTSGSKSKLQGAGIPTVPSVSGIEPTPAMATWNDVMGQEDDDHPAGFTGTVEFVGGDEESEEEEEEDWERFENFPRRASEESLHWDPIDGLHAEPKRKVGDLKKMFEQPSLRRKSTERRSFRKSK